MLSVGIVGLPNAGKSTLFNALLSKQVALVADYPFTTIEPNTGVVKVPDERLERLGGIFKGAQVIPSTIKFIDIAGLVKGAHQGEGLGNEFLSHIQQVDLILHLIGDFSSYEENFVWEKAEIVNLELILKDEQMIGGLLAGKKLEREKKEVLEKIKDGLGKGKLIREPNFKEEEKEIIKEFNFLTDKPMFYVLNLTEEGLKEAAGKIKKFKEKIGPGEVLAIGAKLESDLAELEEGERREYFQVLEIKSGLDKIIRTAFKILGLITFYTVKGGQIISAWEIGRENNILEAAAKVHTDFAKNFIKAEVIRAEELIALGSWQMAREKGRLKVAGKDYRVKDGEVIEFYL